MAWTKHSYQFDAQGNVRALRDETGTITDTFSYDAWGNVIARTGTTRTPFQWKGREGYYKDEETGTYQVRKRPYEPKQGRWTATDPIWPVDGVNSYEYVANNSPNLSDPSGEQIPNIPNPGFIWNQIATRYGKAGGKKASQVLMASTISADFQAKPGQKPACNQVIAPVNSAVAQAAGFDINAWQNAITTGTRSTATYSVTITGQTSIDYTVRPNTMLPGGKTATIADYLVIVRQTVTVTDKVRGTTTSKTGVIFVVGDRIPLPALNNCICSP